MRYSLIREMDISNGEGIGISLFVQGCHFHCKGCFNQETWDFNGGEKWTDEIENEFIKLAAKPHIKRISILGGEPLADENIKSVYGLICKLKKIYPHKNIWLYTGYLWENIKKDNNYLSDLRLMAINSVDIVVDGLFQLSNQDINNKKSQWVGSTNQRVIDVKDTLKNNKVVQKKGTNFE